MPDDIPKAKVRLHMGWLRFLVPLVFAVLVFLLIRYLKPRLQRSRHEAWRKAGLLPEQVDPYDQTSRPSDHPHQEWR